MVDECRISVPSLQRDASDAAAMASAAASSARATLDTRHAGQLGVQVTAALDVIARNALSSGAYSRRWTMTRSTTHGVSRVFVRVSTGGVRGPLSSQTHQKKPPVLFCTRLARRWSCAARDAHCRRTVRCTWGPYNAQMTESYRVLKHVHARSGSRIVVQHTSRVSFCSSASLSSKCSSFDGCSQATQASGSAAVDLHVWAESACAGGSGTCVSGVSVCPLRSCSAPSARIRLCTWLRLL